MSDKNRADGYDCYMNGDEECRAWFARQWAMWPKRADPERTTNLSFHHGGVQAYRDMHFLDPKMSNDFAANLAYLDKE